VRYLIKTFENTNVAFVSFNQFVSNQPLEKAIEDIKAAKQKADIVIVTPHWGNEYQSIAQGQVVEWAHAFIDAGADVIIGAHPHVIQQKEIYKTKTIYYSLGNFIMDQYFSKETKEGLLVEVIINKNKELAFKEYYVDIQNNGQTVLK
jgi:gamma-polyglutamate biosynthesis protein CapA